MTSFHLKAPDETKNRFVATTNQLFLHSRYVRFHGVASSAVLVQILDHGRAALSALKILIPIFSDNASNSNADLQLLKEHRRKKLQIWKCSLLTHRHNMEPVARMLWDMLRPI